VQEQSEQESMEQLIIEAARSSRAHLLRRCGSQQAALDEVLSVAEKLLAVLKGVKNDAAMQALFMAAHDVASDGLDLQVGEVPN
jgi:hypothetical protein